MRVSAGLPTGMEGLTYPIPFSDPENVIRIAKAAEKLGYDSVWGNDHMTTQNYVRAEFPVPPRFWEPLVTYAFVLSETSTSADAPTATSRMSKMRVEFPGTMTFPSASVTS